MFRLFKSKPVEKLEFVWPIWVPVFASPCTADGEFVEADHVQHADLVNHGAEQLRPLLRAIPYTYICYSYTV